MAKIGMSLGGMPSELILLMFEQCMNEWSIAGTFDTYIMKLRTYCKAFRNTWNVEYFYTHYLVPMYVNHGWIQASVTHTSGSTDVRVDTYIKYARGHQRELWVYESAPKGPCAHGTRNILTIIKSECYATQHTVTITRYMPKHRKLPLLEASTHSNPFLKMRALQRRKHTQSGNMRGRIFSAQTSIYTQYSSSRYEVNNECMQNDCLSRIYNREPIQGLELNNDTSSLTAMVSASLWTPTITNTISMSR